MVTYAPHCTEAAQTSYCVANSEFAEARPESFQYALIVSIKLVRVKMKQRIRNGFLVLSVSCSASISSNALPALRTILRSCCGLGRVYLAVFIGSIR